MAGGADVVGGVDDGGGAEFGSGWAWGSACGADEDSESLSEDVPESRSDWWPCSGSSGVVRASGVRSASGSCRGDDEAGGGRRAAC